MAKGATKTTTTLPDPTLQGYRDRYLNNAQNYTTQRPLSFYGVPGYSQANPFAGGGAGVGGGAGRAPFNGPQMVPRRPGESLATWQDRIRTAQAAYDTAPTGAGQPFAPPPDFAPGTDPWVAQVTDPTEFTPQFMNPYEGQVIGGMQSDFDRQRSVLGNRVNDYATKAKAFGGSRAAVLEANGLSEIDRNEGNTLGRFRYQGYSDALGHGLNERMLRMRTRQAEIDAGRSRFDQAQTYGAQNLGLMGGVLSGSPRGQRANAYGGGNSAIQGAAGGALAGSAFGPWGAGIGGGIGLLGSL